MASLLPVDLDGDSLPEILYRGGATRMMFNALSFDFDEDQQPSVESTPTNLGYVVQQPANGVTIARYTSVANAQARLIDLNGDGLKDIVRDAGIGNHEVAQLNLGAGRFSDPLEIIDGDDVAIGITLDEPSPSKCVVE